MVRPQAPGKRLESRRLDMRRIETALKRAVELAARFTPVPGCVEFKESGDPVTAVDCAIDRLLRGCLPQEGEGWLSEESHDDRERLGRSRVWVVDPLDGTCEFIAGIPEWCISIGLVEHGQAVAGGISNPLKGEVFLGSVETGLVLNAMRPRRSVLGKHQEALVFASRSETSRGEWEQFRNAPFRTQAVGSIAYKLACVAAGWADATWTLVPKNEWDVAAGVALLRAAGGQVQSLDGRPLRFNRTITRLDGLVAFAPGAPDWLRMWWKDFRKTASC